MIEERKQELEQLLNEAMATENLEILRSGAEPSLGPCGSIQRTFTATLDILFGKCQIGFGKFYTSHCK